MLENAQAHFLTSIIVRRFQIEPAELSFNLVLTKVGRGAIISKLLEAEAFDI